MKVAGYQRREGVGTTELGVQQMNREMEIVYKTVCMAGQPQVARSTLVLTCKI